MLAYFEQFVNSLNKTKNYLLLANVLLVFFLIVLGNAGVLPLKGGDFVFFALLSLALALYRPGWAFLFFIGTIPLENVNLAPEELGAILRPYQLIGFLTIIALAIRYFSKRLNFKLVRLKWFDYLPIVMIAGSFLSILSAPDRVVSFKLSLILSTFVALYFLVRNYIQNLDDLKRIIPFFLSSSLVVVSYGIWQNWHFMHGGSGFEFMPGRPNATFAEPDWLGAYLAVAISAVYVLLYHFQKNASIKTSLNSSINSSIPGSEPETEISNFVSFAFLVLVYTLLILTVSRSAWLAAFASLFIFLFAIFTRLKFHPGNWLWKETFRLKIKILLSLIASITLVYVFHLTNFQLGNRAASAGTGLQKITVSCPPNDCVIPQIISGNEDLEQCDCRHINLEEINEEKSKENIIREVYRRDPNISVRSQIYQKSWREIKDHPVLGIGWGNIGQILGRDGNGNFYNTSNIFLEIWLGAGVLGFLALIIIFGYILYNGLRRYFYAQDAPGKAWGLFVLSSWFAVFVMNLFNAGLFLGFLWTWIALSVLHGDD